MDTHSLPGSAWWPDARPAELLVLALAALVVVLAARSGWHRGASRLVLSLLGLVAGVGAGVEVAGRIQATWPQTGWGAVGVLVGTVLVVAVVGASLGAWLGGALARGLGKVHLGVLDRTAGAVVRGGLAVVLCAVALTLLPGRWAPWADGPAAPGGGLTQALEQAGHHVLDPVIGGGPR